MLLSLGKHRCDSQLLGEPESALLRVLVIGQDRLGVIANLLTLSLGGRELCRFGSIGIEGADGAENLGVANSPGAHSDRWRRRAQGQVRRPLGRGSDD